MLTIALVSIGLLDTKEPSYLQHLTAPTIQLSQLSLTAVQLASWNIRTSDPQQAAVKAKLVRLEPTSQAYQTQSLQRNLTISTVFLHRSLPLLQQSMGRQGIHQSASHPTPSQGRKSPRMGRSKPLLHNALLDCGIYHLSHGLLAYPA